VPRERSRPSRWRRTGAALPAIAILAASSPAGADLAGDADRLVQQWKLRGAEVLRLEPTFLERGHSKTVSTVRPTRAGVPASDNGCITVAFIAVRTTEFFIDPDDGVPKSRPPEKPPSAGASPLPLHRPPLPNDHRIRSAGGVAMASRCGNDHDELRGATVEMASARGAVEVIVVRSAVPLGEIRDVLPERAAGPIAPRGDPGGSIEPGPLPDRLARAELRARGEGATRVTRASMRSSITGGGEFDLRLPSGCHRVEVMAEIPQAVPRRATDIDAEARSQDGHLFARDRADIPDARLDFCLGEATLVEVPFTGASGSVSVALSDAHWPIPAKIPTIWGPRARAGLAAALLRRHAPEPKEPPILESLGVQGMTQIAVEVEPGHCYLAAVALIRGDARSIRLFSHIGDRAARDEAADRSEGAALAFCAAAEDSALIDVDVRGNSTWWALELWPIGAASP
jgi:hypothetical protein